MQAVLGEQLLALESQSLRRFLRAPIPSRHPDPGDQNAPLINFGSNDYLGLAAEPFIAQAAIEATGRHGTGAGASRLVCGNQAPHVDLENALSAWKGTEAALAFSSGYATALGTIPALVGPEDVVILDKLCHACIIDGAKLSGAVIRVFPHNNLDRMESHLQWARKSHPKARVLVATESVFSMDGDIAPLEGIVDLKERYGAWLLVDEAHAAGILGTTGGGLVQALGLGNRVEVQMGTLSKALGCSGGYICGSRTLVDWLINKARSLIFSTAPSPASAASAAASVRWMSSIGAQDRRAKLFKNVALFQKTWPRFILSQTPIVPVIAGKNEAALMLSERLLAAALLVPAIRYPTVPRGRARLRVTLSASHDSDSIERLTRALREGIATLEGSVEMAQKEIS
ncbi:MAG: glycine C-acetyltransferase/8-amino-7-oxononanoate synthase [Verrucomicrobia bacterium]|nr:MAG: glycine C-acetyltransferase/8-amino-7-oxononanoate synthase [Verrucomicrobiota bacterium]